MFRCCDYHITRSDVSGERRHYVHHHVAAESLSVSEGWKSPAQHLTAALVRPALPRGLSFISEAAELDAMPCRRGADEGDNKRIVRRGISLPQEG